MQALVKAPRMLENGKPVEFSITGNVPIFYLDLTRRLFPEVKETASEDDKPMNIREWEWFKEMEGKITPGDSLYALRTMRKMRQADLAKKIGARPQDISDMEKGRAPICKKTAKLIGEALNINYRHFL